jgi:hypothetical protein
MAAWLGALLGGIGKILEKLPIQGRKERWKNELDKLERRQTELVTGKWDDKKSAEYARNKLRIAELNRLLKNSSDSN